MFRLKCPQCKSRRIKKGYRETPFLWKLYGKHYLHCSSCNWEFEGIVIFARLPSRKERHRLKEEEKHARWLAKIEQSGAEVDSILQDRRTVKIEEQMKNRFSFGSEYDDALLNQPDFDEDFVEDDELLDINFNPEAMPVKVKKRIRLKMPR